MHDCKGRLIEVGDHLKLKAWDSSAQKEMPTIGRVGALHPGATSCNVTAYHLVPGYQPVQCVTVTAKDCEIVQKADGSAPFGGAGDPVPGDAVAGG